MVLPHTIVGTAAVALFSSSDDGNEVEAKRRKRSRAKKETIIDTQPSVENGHEGYKNNYAPLIFREVSVHRSMHLKRCPLSLCFLHTAMYFKRKPDVYYVP